MKSAVTTPLLLVIIAACFAGCASNESANTYDQAQAILDYIKVRQPPQQEKMRVDDHDHWTVLDDKYIIYTTRHEVFLVEFSRRCYELTETPVIADVRRERNTVRARFDTIRGCVVSKIFTINENDVAELTAMGQAPGSGT